MIRLQYVPGGHSNNDFDHCGRNRVTITQRKGMGSTNVTHNDFRGLQEKLGAKAGLPT